MKIKSILLFLLLFVFAQAEEKSEPKFEVQKESIDESYPSVPGREPALPKFGVQDDTIQSTEHPNSETENKNKEVKKKSIALDSKGENLYGTRLTSGPFYQYQQKTPSKSYNSFFYEVDLFLPVLQSEHSLFFVNLRLLDFEGKPIEGNFGLGIRHIFRNYDMLLGFYSFYDRKRTRLKNFFNQITLGLEAKTNRFTFDTNWYIPFGKKIAFQSSS